jgi:hypothetical protein
MFSALPRHADFGFGQPDSWLTNLHTHRNVQVIAAKE